MNSDDATSYPHEVSTRLSVSDTELSKEPKPDNAQVLARAIVFSSLLLAGAIVFAAVAATGVDWFYPTLLFVAATYVVWQRFF